MYHDGSHTSTHRHVCAVLELSLAFPQSNSIYKKQRPLGGRKWLLRENTLYTFPQELLNESELI